jgi:hypothetical protein
MLSLKCNYIYSHFSYLPDLFPRQAPIVYVYPPFSHELLDPQGRVNEACLTNWNFQSSLTNVTISLLSKFEIRQSKQENPQNLNQIISGSEEDEISAKLTRDLNSKSIEELIYINFNQEEYIDEFTKDQRENNIRLFDEVSKLAETTENLKREYAEAKKVIDDYHQEYQKKEFDLSQVIEEKKKVDSNFSIENIIHEMKKDIEEKYEKPKKQLIADFFSKKINFDSFKEEFKKLNQDFHYHNIIKDKMNLYK